MAESGGIFLRAKHRTFSGLDEDAERHWTGPFCFIQAADPQFGLMKAWRDGDCDGGGDEWAEEVELTKQAVDAVNQLRPRPRFMVLCGDLVHAMPDTPFREGQERDLKAALEGTDPSIPLVFVSGNHDLGNTPTPSTVEQYCSAWGDDYFSFWVGGVLCLVLNSQLYYDASACPQLKEAQETWLEEQLSKATSSTETKPKHILVFQHIPLYLKSPDEEDNYFNLQRGVRLNLLDKFKKAGVGGDANESWRIQSFPDVRVPPLLAAGPLTRASHLGSRDPATGPSIPVPCPLGLQPVRQTGRAGGDKRSSLVRQAGACFDDSSIQWGQKCV
uniref:Calcineurin-like phosphoesterase domain containing 1 n=1 Tax=Mastacembelus armatus TaxID=205130 RepID=A0A7N8XJW2_9TELE